VGFFNLAFQGGGSHLCLPSATPLILTNVPKLHLYSLVFTQYKPWPIVQILAVYLGARYSCQRNSLFMIVTVTRVVSFVV